MILAVAAASIFLHFRAAILNEKDWIDIEVGVFTDERGFSVVGFAVVVGAFDVAAAWIGEGDGLQGYAQRFLRSIWSWE